MSEPHVTLEVRHQFRRSTAVGGDARDLEFSSPASIDFDESGNVLGIDVRSVPDSLASLIDFLSTPHSNRYDPPPPGEPNLDVDAAWLWIPISSSGRVCSRVAGESTVSVHQDPDGVVNISVLVDRD